MEITYNESVYNTSIHNIVNYLGIYGSRMEDGRFKSVDWVVENVNSRILGIWPETYAPDRLSYGIFSDMRTNPDLVRRDEVLIEYDNGQSFIPFWVSADPKVLEKHDVDPRYLALCVRVYLKPKPD